MAKKSAAAVLGSKGGKAGRGKAKVRGDADYYRAIVAKRWSKTKKAKQKA